MSEPEELDSGQRRQEILRRAEAGERTSDIARAVGASRQYVHAFLKRKAEGRLGSGRRGRRKDQPMSLEEQAALRAHLLARQGGADGLLPPEAVKAWFWETFGRTITVHQLRRFCTEEGLRLEVPAEMTEGWHRRTSAVPTVEGPRPEGHVPARKRGRPRKSEAPSESGLISEAELEAMRRANEAVAARIGKSVPGTAPIPEPIKHTERRFGRNDPCPLDPRKKFKRCCGASGSRVCPRLGEGG
jgi:hypothetical protein